MTSDRLAFLTALLGVGLWGGLRIVTTLSTATEADVTGEAAVHRSESLAAQSGI